MSKRSWIILGIAILVIIGLLATVKMLPFWATILAFVSYVAGLVSYWAVKKFAPITPTQINE